MRSRIVVATMLSGMLASLAALSPPSVARAVADGSVPSQPSATFRTAEVVGTAAKPRVTIIPARRPSPHLRLLRRAWGRYMDEQPRSLADRVVRAGYRRVNGRWTTHLVVRGAMTSRQISRLTRLPVDTELVQNAPLTGEQRALVKEALGLGFLRKVRAPIEVTNEGLQGDFRVTFGGGSHDSTEVEAAIHASIALAASKLGSSVLPTDVRYVFDPQMQEGEFTLRIRGGVLAGDCTTGFTAYRNGVPGVITADHCGHEIRGYKNQSSVFFWVATAPPFSDGSYIDMMFIRHYGAHESTKAFFSGPATGYDVVTSVSDPGETDLCRYGSRSGRDCGVVDDANMCRTFDGVYTCRVAKVRNMTAVGGDSGGPCFWGTQARGTLTGTVGDSTAYCTVISIAWNRLDAAVRQS